jgi:hypothetical protein
MYNYIILGKKIFFMEKLPLQSMILLKLPTTEVVKLNLVKMHNCKTKDRSNHFFKYLRQYVLVGIPKTLALEQILVDQEQLQPGIQLSQLIFNTIDFVKEVRSSFLDR